MEPIIGLILILLWAGLNVIIALKRRRSGLMFLGLSTVPVVPVIWLVGRLSEGNSTISGWSAFLPPAVAFIAACVVENGPETAARTGAYGNYVKCPFCAEPVRSEAIKCKHCASDLTKPDEMPVV